jgi:hypothetical protein
MRVAIVGTGAGWDRVPDGYSIWCVAGLFGKIKPDRVYEVHSGRYLAKIGMQKEKLEWMKGQNLHIHPSLLTTFPNATVIDFEKIMSKYGRYFTSSVAWMLADAIDSGAEEIAIYGISMSSKEEYAHQKPSCTYLIGWARALGIKVTIQDGSELLAAPFVYGYEDKPEILNAMCKRKEQSINAMNKAEDDWTIAKARYHEEKGAIEAFEFIENNWWSQGKAI